MKLSRAILIFHSKYIQNKYYLSYRYFTINNDTKIMYVLKLQYFF